MFWFLANTTALPQRLYQRTSLVQRTCLSNFHNKKTDSKHTINGPFLRRRLSLIFWERTNGVSSPHIIQYPIQSNMMRSISTSVSAMVQHQGEQKQYDPWPWAAWMSVLVLVWTSWEWRQSHGQISQHLQPALQSLEQQYVTTNRQVKRTIDQRRRLQADIDQMTRENQRYESFIKQHEGRTLLLATSSSSSLLSSSPAQQSNVDSLDDAQAEQWEQLYLTRIDELQDQIMQWNEKRLFQDIANRFPTFKFHARWRTIHQDNDHSSSPSLQQEDEYQDAHFQIRFHLKPYPVEIALLYEMVQTQQFDGFFMDFRIQPNNNNNKLAVLQLQHMNLPTHLPHWPVHHHIRIVQQETTDSNTNTNHNNNWFIVAEPFVHNNNNNNNNMAEEPSAEGEGQKSPPLLQEASPNSVGHILKGFETLRDFCDSHNNNNNYYPVRLLRLEIVAAERVVPRRIQHLASIQEEL
eukprot:scaffold469_cov160-Amphora_coffeaeformis.AAC.10